MTQVTVQETKNGNWMVSNAYSNKNGEYNDLESVEEAISSDGQSVVTLLINGTLLLDG